MPIHWRVCTRAEPFASPLVRPRNYSGIAWIFSRGHPHCSASFASTEGIKFNG